MRSGVFYDIKKLKIGKYGIGENSTGNMVYYNGYIFMNLSKSYPYLREAIESIVEVTYEARHSHGIDEYRVLGFDIIHNWNIENPETQTYNAVENTIYEIFEKWDDLLKENNYGN